MEIKEQKRRLRKEFLLRRRTLENRFEKDQKILERILHTDWYAQARSIYTYVSYRAEVDTKKLIQQAWKDGKNVAVPKVCGEIINFYQIHSMDDLESGIKGILEPAVHCIPLEEQDAVLLVPGAVFDQEGYRIGYGGGFYDRYLETHPNYLSVALAYECQVIDYVPRQPWDQKIDCIITEEACI
ncbi:putative 5-formyltetrahydrofolate cyclo-ligase [Clostridiales bacterium CHKCI001]|nr:putative 5-formyltetrahydrofolate cyclo-ligase [Clostridiales bacterium CHKCI001]